MTEAAPPYSLADLAPESAPSTHKPLIAPLPATDRRIAHNNALRSLVIMGEGLKKRLAKRIDGAVDFDAQGAILAWEHALERLRSFDR